MRADPKALALLASGHIPCPNEIDPEQWGKKLGACANYKKDIAAVAALAKDPNPSDVVTKQDIVVGGSTPTADDPGDVSDADSAASTKALNNKQSTAFKAAKAKYLASPLSYETDPDTLVTPATSKSTDANMQLVATGETTPHNNDSAETTSIDKSHAEDNSPPAKVPSEKTPQKDAASTPPPAKSSSGKPASSQFAAAGDPQSDPASPSSEDSKSHSDKVDKSPAGGAKAFPGSKLLSDFSSSDPPSSNEQRKPTAQLQTSLDEQAASGVPEKGPSGSNDATPLALPKTRTQLAKLKTDRPTGTPDVEGKTQEQGELEDPQMEIVAAAGRGSGIHPLGRILLSQSDRKNPDLKNALEREGILDGGIFDQMYTWDNEVCGCWKEGAEETMGEFMPADLGLIPGGRSVSREVEEETLD